MICPACKTTHIIATSDETGCCDYERMRRGFRCSHTQRNPSGTCLNCGMAKGDVEPKPPSQGPSVAPSRCGTPLSQLRTTDQQRARNLMLHRSGVWKDVVVAYTSASNSITSEKAIQWADDILAAFDRRFPL